MQFIKGTGWKACYDSEQNLYSAERGGAGYYDLYQIDEAVFTALGREDITDAEAERLIYENGRHLYMAVDDRCGPPYTVILDDDYEKLCPWASVVHSGKVWSEELTDAAVEVFASEADNREQRRKKRERKKQP